MSLSTMTTARLIILSTGRGFETGNASQCTVNCSIVICLFCSLVFIISDKIYVFMSQNRKKFYNAKQFVVTLKGSTTKYFTLKICLQYTRLLWISQVSCSVVIVTENQIYWAELDSISLLSFIEQLWKWQEKKSPTTLSLKWFGRSTEKKSSEFFNLWFQTTCQYNILA